MSQEVGLDLKFLMAMSTLALELKVTSLRAIKYQEVSSNHKNSVRLAVECLKFNFPKNVNFIP